MPLTFKDPNLEAELKANTKLGMMPAPAPSGVLAGLRGALSPALSVVESAPVAQVQPGNFAVDNLVSGLKERLSQIPTSASRAGIGMGTSAQGTNDILNPSSMQMMDKMYQEANPVFKALQNAGKFAGDRTVGGIGGLK